MTQAGVEEHEAVKVRVVRVEVLCVMHGMEVIDVGCDFHLRPQSIFDNCAKGVGGCAFGQGELIITVGHALGSDEDEIDQGVGEHVRELKPNFAGQRGFGAGSENEDANWWRLES